IPVKCTNRSRPPSSGVMKPKPLSSLNHLTVPVAMYSPLMPLLSDTSGRPPRASSNAGKLARRVASGLLGKLAVSRLTRGRPASVRRPRPARGSPERVGRGGDLLRIPLSRGPRQAQGVALIAGDHVEMEVKD